MNTVQKALALINQEFAHQQQALALAQDRQKHLQDDCDRACAKLQQEQERSQELAKSAEELRQTQDWHPQELAKLSHVVWDAVREHAAQLIVYGAQALNYYLRPQAHLTSTTRDWDVFVQSWDELTGICSAVEQQLRAAFPQRSVWCKAARNNPDASLCLFVSRQACLDLTLAPTNIETVCDAETGLRYVSIGWLFNNLRALLVNANASYRHQKDRARLTRLCLADAAGERQLPSAERSEVLRAAGLFSDGELEAQIAALEERCQHQSSLLEARGAEQRRLAELEQQVAALQQQQRGQEQTAAVLERLRREKDTTTRTQTELLRQLRLDNQRLLDQAAERDSQLETLRGQLRAREQELKSRQQQLGAAERRATRAENQCKDLEEQAELRCSQLTRSLEEMNETSRHAQRSTSAAEAEVKRLEEKLAHHNSKTKEFVTQLGQYRRDTQALLQVQDQNGA